MKLHPEGDKILIREIDGLDKTEGGIWIPREGKDGKPAHHYAAVYEIVEMGPGRYSEMGSIIPMPDYKPGDFVFLSSRVQGHGIVEIEGDRLGLVQPHDIVGRVELNEEELEKVEKAKLLNRQKRKQGALVKLATGTAELNEEQLGKVRGRRN